MAGGCVPKTFNFPSRRTTRVLRESASTYKAEVPRCARLAAPAGLVNPRIAPPPGRFRFGGSVGGNRALASLTSFRWWFRTGSRVHVSGSSLAGCWSDRRGSLRCLWAKPL